MRISTTTAPTVEPVTLAEVKKHLRLATTEAGAAAYTSEDDLLNRLITVARTQAEQETGRAFITQTKTMYLDGWPDEDFIRLPYPTLQSAAVTYRLEDDDDYDETLSTVDTDIVSEPGRVVLQPNESWPSGTLYTDRPIKIVFVCGYGDSGNDVPAPIKAAILLRITDMYEHRGEVIVGLTTSRIQGAVDALLRQYRIFYEF
jgi:uncharacterized phiE125 gp8 family phage protein